jgi:hypothetical protein
MLSKNFWIFRYKDRYFISAIKPAGELGQLVVGDIIGEPDTSGIPFERLLENATTTFGITSYCNYS